MLEYLKDHIIEELDGAVEYWSKAFEHKNTEMGCVFKKMAEMELEHANALLKMFNKADKPKTITDTEYKNMYKEILDAYTEKMSKIKTIEQMYWNK